MGDFEKTEDGYRITYKEYDNENPEIYTSCVVKIGTDNTVSLIKRGSVQTELILEKDKRHHTPYHTKYGMLMMGIYTKCVDFCYNEDSGKLILEYSIDINSVPSGTNRVVLDFRRIRNEE